MSEKISIVRRLRLEANALGEFQTYASRDYRRTLLDAADEIERLRKERDEARRSVCEQEAQDCFLMPDKLGKGTIVNTPQMEASRRGWDCYKEDSK